MKKMFSLIVCAIAISILFLITSCNDSSMVLKVSLEGYVYDSLGGKPVEGVWVYLYGCSYDDKDEVQYTPFIIGQAVTDVSGRFYLHDDAARSHRYGLVVNKQTLKGSFGMGCNNNWLKANFSKIYLNNL